MEVICIPVTALFENAYIYYDPDTLEGVMLDPGGNASKLVKAVEVSGVSIKAVCLTHGHFDHIGAAAELRDFTHAGIYAAEAEDAVLGDSLINGSITYTKRPIVLNADFKLRDGDVISFNNFKLRLLHTPGHTCGSCCWYDEENGIVFTGDTLFYRNIGRTDFATGSQTDIIHSIKNKLYTLPDVVAVYPGHGEKTSIGAERAGNPYV